MASLSKTKDIWRIQFTIDGKRRTFYPGVTAKKQAQTVKFHIEAIVSARKSGTAIPDATSEWIGSREIIFREKLSSVGLIEAPQKAEELPTLANFITKYIETRSDVKDSTKTVWRRCEKLLNTFFKADRLLDSFTVGDAKDFRQYLKQKQSENTVRRMCGIARQFFHDAIDRELIHRNPFVHKSIPTNTQANRTRDHFITRDDAEKVLEACPDAEWRLLFALSRFGGLRCPSEHLLLRWEHVLWDQKRLIVPSPKTERHLGREQRVIPLFPELMAPLSEMWDQAKPGQEFIINKYRSSESNLRTQLRRIIGRAGLVPWAKLFHNLRMTRQNELAKDFPIHVVCSWIGNTKAVAWEHYLRANDEDFERATNCVSNVISDVEGNCIEANCEEQRTSADSENRMIPAKSLKNSDLGGGKSGHIRTRTGDLLCVKQAF